VEERLAILSEAAKPMLASPIPAHATRYFADVVASGVT
jgi:hypothetical protein